MKRPTYALAAIILAAGFSSIAAAAESAATVTAADGVPAKTVRYSDLNLTRARGITTLYHRITKAAEVVCDSVNPRAPQNAARARICTQQAIARAVKQVNIPALALYHARIVGTPDSLVQVSALRQDR